MEDDRSLFGDGRYPRTGPLAVLARLALGAALLAIVVAVFLPAQQVPDFVKSPYLQHFAAFYVLTLCALSAFPRSRLRNVATAIVVFASVLEASQLIAGAVVTAILDNWVADMGGLAAAVGPVVVERFRRRFPRDEP